jgi:hypothetical protein
MSMYSHIDKDGPRPQAAKLVVRALDGLLADQARSAAARGLSTHDFQQLFAYLEAMRDHLEPGDLVRLQWSYLPALGYDAKVPALSESLAADPAKFVDIVCTVYRARPKSEDEEGAEGHRLTKSNGTLPWQPMRTACSMHGIHRRGSSMAS